MSFGQLMWSGYDCSDEAAGLDIKGGMIVISLQHVTST
jgi:hypothetical protein